MLSDNIYYLLGTYVRNCWTVSGPTEVQVDSMETAMATTIAATTIAIVVSKPFLHLSSLELLRMMRRRKRRRVRLLLLCYQHTQLLKDGRVLKN